MMNVLKTKITGQMAGQGEGDVTMMQGEMTVVQGQMKVEDDWQGTGQSCETDLCETENDK